MTEVEKFIAELPPERRRRVELMAEIFKMSLAEALREVAMAEWQNSLNQQLKQERK